MGFFKVTDAQVEQFARDGYLFVKDFLDAEEVEMLSRAARGDDMVSAAQDILDTQGKKSRLTLWNHPGDDIFGMVSRSARVVDTMAKLLGDEVYHYHSKIMMKEPKVGGAWEWHQDYGYWYQNGCLYPDLASCMIALDAATKENGCLQVLRASHKMGRVEHGRFGDQTGADPERVAAAKERLELVYCEMTPGMALFFHSNLLHCSAPNTSDRPRWALICCYNTKSNDPYKDAHHPRYTPLKTVPDQAIKEVGRKSAAGNRTFYHASEDLTTGAGKS